MPRSGFCLVTPSTTNVWIRAMSQNPLASRRRGQSATSSQSGRPLAPLGGSQQALCPIRPKHHTSQSAYSTHGPAASNKGASALSTESALLDDWQSGAGQGARRIWDQRAVSRTAIGDGGCTLSRRAPGGPKMRQRERLAVAGRAKKTWNMGGSQEETRHATDRPTDTLAAFLPRVSHGFSWLRCHLELLAFFSFVRSLLAIQDLAIVLPRRYCHSDLRWLSLTPPPALVTLIWGPVPLFYVL